MLASSDNLEITAMTLKHAITQFIATNDLAPQQLELAERILNAPKPGRELADRIPLYPHRTAKKESLCQLRWRHLQHVTTMARDPNHDRMRPRKNCSRISSIFSEDFASGVGRKCPATA
jgi:hypothetical protein